MLAASMLCLGAAATTPGHGGSSAEARGTVSADSEARWTGQLVPLSDVASVSCRPEADPRCDVYELTVDAPVGTTVQVDVTAASEFDQVVAEVHRPGGSMIAASDAADRVTVSFVHGLDHDGATYHVMVRPELTNVESTLAGGVTYTGKATLVDAHAGATPCPGTDVVPDAVELDAAAVTLDVLVLLDGVSPQHAHQIVQEASWPYDELGISMAWSFQTVSLVGTVDTELIAASKAAVGGHRPSGVDLVYTLTDKEITNPDGDDAVAGSADCVGGIKSAQWAFAVGETSEVNAFGMLPSDNSSIVMAHELGHLLGAHHHLFTCTQPTEPVVAARQGVCTLMAPDTFLGSHHFSAANGAIVRGYAQRYAG